MEESFLNAKIKVGMIISTYFPEWGGAQRQLSQIAKYLVKNDVEVFILTRRLPRTKKYEKIDGIDVYRVFVTNRSRVLDSLLYIFLSLAWLMKNRNKFAILHCYQMYSPTSIGVIAKKIIKNIKVLVKVTASNEYGETREIIRLPLARFRIRLLRSVDKFLVVNERMRYELGILGIPPSKIEYIPNGVDVDEESVFLAGVKDRFRNSLGMDFKKIVIFTGRLSEEKCLDTLLSSWSRLHRSFPEAHLLILGKGRKERSVEEKITKMRIGLNLDKCVHLLGEVDNVRDYLLASDIFVLPSISEGLSNSLLEAMAVGLGVIAGDNDGNRQVVTSGENGILVKPEDTQALYSALVNLLQNEEHNESLGRRAKESIRNVFDIENITKKYISLYRNITLKS